MRVENVMLKVWVVSMLLAFVGGALLGLRWHALYSEFGREELLKRGIIHYESQTGKLVYTGTKHE